MWTYCFGTARRLSSLTFLLLLTACGGGGGGGGGLSPVVYGGNASPAVISVTNASKLTANVIGSDDTGTIILGVSTESSDATQNQGSGLVDLSRRLSREFRDIAVRSKRAGATQQVVPAVLVPVNETEPCDGNVGSVTTTGTIDVDDTTGTTGTGTLTVTFSNCLIDGVTLNGPATLQVDAFDLDPLDPMVFIPTDFTISFTRLTLRGVGLSVDVGGSLQTQIAIGTDTETITQNFVTLDNNTNLMTKIEDFKMVSVYDDVLAPTSFTADIIDGSVFDQIHGYVDVVTTLGSPLTFSTLNQLFPDSGQILLTGAGNSSIRVTALPVPPAALPATLARLELDLDGNSIYEIDARLKWTDLSEPAGSNLADNDNDNMHNSWESANGLDPVDVNDAVEDKDGDAFTNPEEYLAGTDPSDALSHP